MLLCAPLPPAVPRACGDIGVCGAPGLYISPLVKPLTGEPLCAVPSVLPEDTVTVVGFVDALKVWLCAANVDVSIVTVVSPPVSPVEYAERPGPWPTPIGPRPRTSGTPK